MCRRPVSPQCNCAVQYVFSLSAVVVFGYCEIAGGLALRRSSKIQLSQIRKQAGRRDGRDGGAKGISQQGSR